MNSGIPLRLTAIMEAATVTGPAKNLIAFCRASSSPGDRMPGLPLLEPFVVTYARGGQAQGPFLDALKVAGIPAEAVLERYRFDSRAIAQLNRIVGFRQPHLVQTHNVKSHFLFRVSGQHKRFPWIAFHHGYTATDLKMRAYNQLDRWSLRAPRLLITVCRPFADELTATGVPRSKIRILHNSVRIPTAPSESVLSDLRSRLRIPEGDNILISVGRFSHEKGFDQLLSAFAALRNLEPTLRVRLVLVGDGPEREALEKQASTLGIRDHVIFAGQVSDVSPFYGIADALALPSRSEGSPNVVLEAMAAGVPIAAMAVGGVPEIIDDKTGLLVRSGDISGMAHCLGRLLTDQALSASISDHALRKVQNEFQPEHYRRALFEIYREVLG